jgi:hypothetical protein
VSISGFFGTISSAGNPCRKETAMRELTPEECRHVGGGFYEGFSDFGGAWGGFGDEVAMQWEGHPTSLNVIDCRTGSCYNYAGVPTNDAGTLTTGDFARYDRLHGGY